MNTTYEVAKEQYAAVGVDTEEGLRVLGDTPISLHCWQGDDVGGFENAGGELGGGLAVTGNYPGKARTIEELRQDIERALSLLPGPHRINLHAIYGDFEGKKVERDAVAPEHFASWIEWCAENGLGFDFNPTCFGHPKASDGLTLSHPDKGIRDFWIAHCQACRVIGQEAGKRLGSPCVTNIWIPDGMKDTPVDRFGPRKRLADSLERILTEPADLPDNLDAVESKLFGIGSESYVVGSHEFYLGFAAQHQCVLCLDAGHFHPTESVADKISAVMLFVPELLLHVSRGVRWDSDHVVTLDDPTKAMLREVVAGGFLPRTHIGLDFFDASINRIAAWAIGTRAARKAVLLGLLEPTGKLREAEQAGDYTERLAQQEDLRTLPFGEVWNEFCRRKNVPEDGQWLAEVRQYEKEVLSKRV